MPQDQVNKSVQKDVASELMDLQPAVHSPSPEQALAVATVKQRAGQAAKLLIKRSKALAVLLAINLFSLCTTLFGLLLSMLHHNSAIGADLFTLLMLLNIPLQASAAGYLVRAKDPDTCKNILKVFLILNTMELLMGFYSFGSFTLTLLTLTTTLVAYGSMTRLKQELEAHVL